ARRRPTQPRRAAHGRLRHLAGRHRIALRRLGHRLAYSCSQKCLGAPPGMSPVAVSDRALERIAQRTRPVPYAIDLSLLHKYWVDRPLTYHHTTPVLHVYALHEALREVALEGLQARWERHLAAGRFLQDEAR